MKQTLQSTTPRVTESLPETRNPERHFDGLQLPVRERGHRLVRVPWRGYVVRKRLSAASGLGPLLAAGGLGAMLADLSLASFGRIAIIVGVICIFGRRLEQKIDDGNKFSSEQYQWAKDIGYEEGYRDGREEARPSLIDLNSRRNEALGTEPLTHAGPVVDRG